MNITIETKLAQAFSRILKSWLSEDEMNEVVRRNNERNDDTCASHDFCDANMAMLEAFEEIVGEYDFQSDEHLRITNSSWQIAKDSSFFIEEK